jgi:hypothetical protein
VDWKARFARTETPGSRLRQMTRRGSTVGTIDPPMTALAVPWMVTMCWTLLGCRWLPDGTSPRHRRRL